MVAPPSARYCSLYPPSFFIPNPSYDVTIIITLFNLYVKEKNEKRKKQNENKK